MKFKKENSEDFLLTEASQEQPQDNFQIKKGLINSIGVPKQAVSAFKRSTNKPSSTILWDPFKLRIFYDSKLPAIPKETNEGGLGACDRNNLPMR